VWRQGTTDGDAGQALGERADGGVLASLLPLTQSHWAAPGADWQPRTRADLELPAFPRAEPEAV